MSAKVASLIQARLAGQPNQVCALPEGERDLLIVSATQVDGTWVILSQYGHDTWTLTGGTSNQRGKGRRILDFRFYPEAFRSAAKEILYLYIRRGREGFARPGAGTIARVFDDLLCFLRHLESLKLKHIGAVTPMVCATYVAACKSLRQTRRKGKPLSDKTLQKLFGTVELLHELSQLTLMPMPSHPWPETSAKRLAGLSGRADRSQTPIIPDEVFTVLFQEAYASVKRGNALLDLRDQLAVLEGKLRGRSQRVISDAKNSHLSENGWNGGLRGFTEAVTEIRTACYIVVASLSGCRNHELAYVQSKAYHRTEDNEGEVYWWMQSQSDKTRAGKTDWMIPEAAVEALRLMDRWAVPFQQRLAREIVQRRSTNPLDPEITEAQRHVNALFLGIDKNDGHQVRTLSSEAWNHRLKAFARGLGLDWDVATHQFRRTFANYAARSRFGDLRYLREHFKHWSQDMTNDGYALNESQEMELYAEIQDELDLLKLGVAEQWLTSAEPLAGGYGKNLIAWRSDEESIALFKDRQTMVRAVAESHAIRSNGHAWCTADDNKCIGNTFEKTRCSGCDRSVIGRFHARLYQRLYDDLKDVASCDDIGRAGQLRVQRDIERCREVLTSLGYDPEAQAA